MTVPVRIIAHAPELWDVARPGTNTTYWDAAHTLAEEAWSTISYSYAVFRGDDDVLRYPHCLQREEWRGQIMIFNRIFPLITGSIPLAEAYERLGLHPGRVRAMDDVNAAMVNTWQHFARRYKKVGSAKTYVTYPYLANTVLGWKEGDGDVAGDGTSDRTADGTADSIADNTAGSTADNTAGGTANGTTGSTAGSTADSTADNTAGGTGRGGKSLQRERRPRVEEAATTFTVEDADDDMPEWGKDTERTPDGDDMFHFEDFAHGSFDSRDFQLLYESKRYNFTERDVVQMADTVADVMCLGTVAPLSHTLT